MEHFTPIAGLIGGGLIGLGAALYVVVLGRVAGISGIVGGLLSKRPTDAGLRIAFIGGLIAGPLLLQATGAPLPQIDIQADWPLLVIGGLLVGFGTQMGSGCTSGHGVCGLARLSPRSLVSTALFMGMGVLVVYIARHVVGG